MAEVTAATEHQTYQGTVVLRELTGMEAVVALKPSIIDLSASGRPDGMFFRSNMPLNRVSPQVGIKSVDPVSQGTPDSPFLFQGQARQSTVAHGGILAFRILMNSLSIRSGRKPWSTAPGD